MDVGEYARSPWTGSAISKKRKQLEDPEDTSIDYSEESEELSHEKPAFQEEGPADVPEAPEEEYLD